MLIALSSGQKLGLGLVAGAFIVFALLSSMVIPRFRPDFPGRGLKAYVVLVLVFTAGMLGAVVALAGESEKEHEAATTEMTGTAPTGTAPTEPAPATTETAPPAAPAGDAAAGRTVFASAGCGGCHTLAAAGSSGTVGPNLDEAKPSLQLIVDRVTNGRGVMPSFRDSLSERQIADVAAFVFESTR